MSPVVYWPEVTAFYGASVVAVAPEDRERVLSDIERSVADGHLDGEDAARLVMVDDPSLSGLDVIEYRAPDGTILGRAKAR